jgi:hypothetical protein
MEHRLRDGLDAPFVSALLDGDVHQALELTG